MGISHPQNYKFKGVLRTNKGVVMKNLTSVIFLCLLFLCLQSGLRASGTEGGKNNRHIRSNKVLTDPQQSLININNVTSWVSQEGYHDWIVGGAWNGSFPISVTAGTIFSEGIVWGGQVNDGAAPLIRVNGNTYSSGCEPITRVYRVRTNYRTASLLMDAATFFNISQGEVTQAQINQIYTQYETDWNNWPAEEGAPYQDINEDGIYEAEIDIPGVPSASQTLFIKYADSSGTPPYGSPAIGLEVSETYWAFSGHPELLNTIFKKTDITYTGGSGPSPGSYIDSMFICQWSDPDVGNSGDDFAGCDTSLNLGFAYNSSNTDAVYASLNFHPPASGYAMLQGVSEYTGNPSDSAIFNFRWRKGYKYSNPKPLSSFIYFAAGGTWTDPAFTYTGALEFFNLMRGYKPDPPYPSGEPFPESVADYTANGCYLLTGDPVTGTGKLDGTVDPPGDRRILSVSGPFHMELGDQVEIVTAFISALSTSNLAAITRLRQDAVSADSAFQTLVDSSYAVGVETKTEENLSFKLLQNYPNPFNPVTSIQYTLSEPGIVSLKVYDILGREVVTLVNKEQAVGNHSVQFDGRDLSSGIYIYKLTTSEKDGEGFVSSRKMLLLK